MKPTLRDYQLRDAKKLMNLNGAACFNEQRTGKTLIALKLAESSEKILIVTTASTIPQWQYEFERYTNKPCLTCIGNSTKKRRLIKEWKHGLVISLDSLKETSRTDGYISEILNQNPDMVILDEAHRIKNPKSQNARAMFKLTKIKKRLALTGTPAPGKPADIYPILKFIDPDTWKGFWKFLEEYFIIKDEIIYTKGTRRTFKTWDEFQPNKEHKLQEYLNKISTNTKRKDVMQWIPDKFYVNIPLEPNAKQKKYLRELNEAYTTEQLVAQGTLDRLVKYRQICLDPDLLHLEGRSPKTDWLIQYIQDYPDEQIIIFSKFTSYLLKLYKALDKYCKEGLIIGKTPIPQRQKIVQNFQNNCCGVLLINVDAGKEGLTLDNADTTIFTDRYPPIGTIQQAEDRFIASVKEMTHKGHKIINLYMKNTFDEQLNQLLDKRAEETDVINSYKKYIERRTK